MTTSLNNKVVVNKIQLESYTNSLIGYLNVTEIIYYLQRYS